MIFEHHSYRSFLKAELANRVGENSAYSQRLFAYELGVAHTFLSDVLRGRSHFSNESAAKIASRLGLKGDESEYFRQLVIWERTDDPDLKEIARSRMSEIRPGAAPADLSTDHFKYISDWYHFAILQLTEVPSAVFTAESIAGILEISVIEASAAIERLERLELLEKDVNGSYRKVRDALVFRSAVPQAALLRFNQQMLDKARNALSTQPWGERFSGTETFAIAPEDLPKAEALMEQFLAQVAGLCQTSAPKNQVFHVNVQMFGLTKKEKRSKS